MEAKQTTDPKLLMIGVVVALAVFGVVGWFVWNSPSSHRVEPKAPEPAAAVIAVPPGQNGDPAAAAQAAVGETR